MLTLVQQIKYHTPVVITPKKEGTVSIITDYFRLNHKLVRKLYPLSRIGDTMKDMEGLYYATALDLNMVYYSRRMPKDRKSVMLQSSDA